MIFKLIGIWFTLDTLGSLPSKVEKAGRLTLTIRFPTKRIGKRQWSRVAFPLPEPASKNHYKASFNGE